MPASLRSTPWDRSLSRSKTTSACGWSNFKSASANMKRPLAKAFPTSWLANSVSLSGSAVEATTKSTGKSPPPGSAGGMSEITRTPGTFESPMAASTCSCSVVFLRWLQGFVTMPPKPPVGLVIWKMLSASGNDRYTSWTCDEKSFVCSIVALGAAWMTPKTTLWSSFGASSFCENM